MKLSERILADAQIHDKTDGLKTALDTLEVINETAQTRVAELEIDAECWAIVSSGILPEIVEKYKIAARSNLKR